MTAKEKLDTRPVLTPEEVADRIGTSRLTAQMLMKSGKIKAVNTGAATRDYYRSSEQWVQDFIDAGGVQASPQEPTAPDGDPT